MVVLPSKNIFVGASTFSDLLCLLTLSHNLIAYYNEARILDPTTFATIKVLPNIPGAVNDCEYVHQHLTANA